jgi:hypothetical protein
VADHGGSHLAPEAMAAYGESLAILERVVVAPAVGQVDSQRVSTLVCSPFESRLMGMLAVAGGGTSSQANRSLGCWSAAARPALDDHWKGVIAMPEPALHPCRCST